MSSRYAIVVPAYNCEPYVAATLTSLMEQGSALHEIDSVILTDDASTDRTIEVGRAVWSGAVPLKILQADKNRGEYANMNECVARLPDHIEWFLIMHADNLAKPGWLKAIVERINLADENVGTISTSWDDLREDGVVIEGENRDPNVPEKIVGSADSVAGTLKRGCWWHISSCAIRVRTYREIGGLPLGLRLKGDWDFLLRLLSCGWDVEYVPRALMTYRTNPLGSSSITFRRHRDVHKSLAVTRRHLHALSARDVAAIHIYHLKTLFRRFAGGLLRGHFERAAACVPTAGEVIKSLASCCRAQRLGRRQFNWISSVDANARARLDLLATAMTEFYSKPGTRGSYQEMLEAVSSAQPETDRALCTAVLASKPSAVLEVGCGSGQIYAHLADQGLNCPYMGVELSPDVIESNKIRFPKAVWLTGNGYRLPVDPASQDCIIARYVLEHCTYPRKFLKSLLAATKPGGSIFLTFPDMADSGIFGSQALGWNGQSAKLHLRHGRIIHALIRLWDTQIRLPLALRRAASNPGLFLVNLRPKCLEADVRIEPDVDAIYVANRREVVEWAHAQGCATAFPAGESGILYRNVLVQITKPGR